MKKTFTLFAWMAITCVLMGQNMNKGYSNYSSFTSLSQKQVITEELATHTPENLKSHPEYGILPFGIPKTDCYEVLEKRTVDSRFYQSLSNPSRFYIEKVYGALHYKDAQGRWISIDDRLRPTATPGFYHAPFQAQPKTLNINGQYASITVNGVEMKINKHLQMYHEAADGTRTSMGTANWSDFQVGDAGVWVKNIWPNVDMHISYTRRALKTDFVVNKEPSQQGGYLVISDKLDLPNGYRFAIDNTNFNETSAEGYMGNLLVNNAQGENYFTMSRIIVYDAKIEKKRQKMFHYAYNKENLEYEIRIPMSYMKDAIRKYPVTIDPAVTGPIATYNLGDIPFIDAATSYCTFNTASYCSNTLTVVTPANSTLTSAFYATHYVALDWLSNGGGCGLSDCWMEEAGFSVHNTNCPTSNSGILSCTNSPDPGDCYTINASGGGSPASPGYVEDPALISPTSCNPPQCTPYNVVFEMRTFSCFSCSGGCQTDCHYMPNGKWKMFLEGETIGSSVAITSGASNICAGQSVTITAAPTNGVPNYTYNWVAGTTGNGPSVTVSPTSTTTYSVQVTDACGQMVQNNQTITVSTPANAAFTYDNSTYCQNATAPIISYPTGGVAGTFTSTPAGLSLNSVTGAINLAASTPGNYTVTNTVTASAPCTNSVANVNITIAAAAIADFSYDQANYCQSGAAPILTHSGGGVNGTYTAAPAGLSLNPSTGAINLGASSPGTYTVTNTVQTGGGLCQDIHDFVVTINAAPNASFNYDNNVYCLTSADPILTVTGVAGTFTATPALGGLSSNGQISLAASTAGNYTITNTVTVGGCTSTASVAITIVTAPNAEFVYDNTAYCQNGAAPILSHPGGGSDGVYTSTAGLSINSANGAINLAASTPGTYTVTNTVTGGSGCVDVETFSITINATPNANFNYNAASFCLSGANPILTVTGSAGTFTASPVLGGLSSNGQISLAGSTAGTYTITNTVTQAGCTGTASVPVTLNAAPIAAFTYDNNIYCQSGAAPIINITGGTGTFSSTAGLSLNTTTGAINLGASTPGNYTVTQTVTAAGCPSATASFAVSIIAVPNAEFSYSAASYCQNGGNITPVHTAGGVNGVYSVTAGAGLSINASTGVINLGASAVGTYTIQNLVSGSGVCADDIETFTLTISAPTNAEFSYGTSTLCQSGNNATPLHLAGGTSGIYTSSPAGLVIDPFTGVITVATSTIGTYTVTNTVAANGACAGSNFVQNISIVTNPNAEFSYASASYCQGGSNPAPLHLNGGTNGTYSASSGGLSINAVTGIIDLTASQPGTYTVTNTIAPSGGCLGSTFTQQVTIVSPPNANFSYGANAFCQTGSNPFPAHPNGGVDGLYAVLQAGLSINSATGEINLASSLPGTYTVTNTVIGTGGCPNVVFSQTVTISPALNAEFSYGANAFCQTAATNPTAIHANGGAPGVFTAATVVGTGTISVNATTGTINLSASAPGTYIITNTLAANAGCAAATYTQVVVISSAPDATFMYDAAAYCLTGNNPVLTHPVGASDGTYTYTSSTGGTLSLNPLTGDINLAASTLGTYTITNTIPAANGCAAVSYTQTITLTTAPDAEFVYNGTAFCKTGTNPVLTHPNGGVDGIYSFVVLSGGPALTLDPITGNIVLASSDFGTYQVTNVVPAAGGCPASSFTQTIVIEGAPDAEFHYDRPIYCGTSIIPEVLHTTGVNGLYSYVPYNGGTGTILLNPNTGSIDLQFSTTGIYQVTNIVASQGVCPADTHTVLVTYAHNPVATINPSGGFFDLCDPNVGALTLQASGGAAYLWLNYGSSLGVVSDQYTVTTPGSYSVVAFNVEGCSDTSGIVIATNNQLPNVNLITGPQLICKGQTVTLAAEGSAGAYQWWLNGNQIPNATTATLITSQEGLYAVTVSNLCGTDTAIVPVNVSPGPQADFFVEPDPLYAGQSASFTDQSISGAIWSWSFGNGGTANIQNPDFVYPQPGQYLVTMYIADNLGCRDTIAKTIVVALFSMDSVFVPNIFTPNGDNYYDEFLVSNATGLEGFELKVFDRWGNKVYESDSPTRGWNGNNLSGGACSEGVYFFTLEVKDSLGETYRRKGNITLLR